MTPRLLTPVLLLALNGCHLPGRPGPKPDVPRPEEVLDFPTLYAQNCAACHGADGQNGAATDLANPLYEALIDDSTLRGIIAQGEPHTLMPGFGTAGGGQLTDAQVDVLLHGMRQRWARANAFGGITPPTYHATLPGEPGHGAAVYAAACARCHGPDPNHPGRAGSILDGSFLALINPQTVRTTLLAGRPDLGQPDFRSLIPNRPLSDSEITDVTAWLIAQTPERPGHPYPNQQPTSERPGEQQPLANKNPAQPERQNDQSSPPSRGAAPPNQHHQNPGPNH